MPNPWWALAQMSPIAARLAGRRLIFEFSPMMISPHILCFTLQREEKTATDHANQTFDRCIKCTVCVRLLPGGQNCPAYPGPKQAGPDGSGWRIKSP